MEPVSDTTALMVIFYIIVFIISTITLICFFVLCSNVSKIKKKYTQSDSDEYYLQKNIGDKEKAFYYLQRDFLLKDRTFMENNTIQYYSDQFNKLGLGVPVELAKKFKNRGFNENGTKA